MDASFVNSYKVPARAQTTVQKINSHLSSFRGTLQSLADTRLLDLSKSIFFDTQYRFFKEAISIPASVLACASYIPQTKQALNYFGYKIEQHEKQPTLTDTLNAINAQFDHALFCLENAYNLAKSDLNNREATVTLNKQVKDIQLNNLFNNCILAVERLEKVFKDQKTELPPIHQCLTNIKEELPKINAAITKIKELAKPFEQPSPDPVHAPVLQPQARLQLAEVKSAPTPPPPSPPPPSPPLKNPPSPPLPALAVVSLSPQEKWDNLESKRLLRLLEKRASTDEFFVFLPPSAELTKEFQDGIIFMDTMIFKENDPEKIKDFLGRKSNYETKLKGTKKTDRKMIETVLPTLTKEELMITLGLYFKSLKAPLHELPYYNQHQKIITDLLNRFDHLKGTQSGIVFSSRADEWINFLSEQNIRPGLFIEELAAREANLKKEPEYKKVPFELKNEKPKKSDLPKKEEKPSISFQDLASAREKLQSREPIAPPSPKSSDNVQEIRFLKRSESHQNKLSENQGLSEMKPSGVRKKQIKLTDKEIQEKFVSLKSDAFVSIAEKIVRENKNIDKELGDLDERIKSLELAVKLTQDPSEIAQLGALKVNREKVFNQQKMFYCARFF